MLESEHYRLLRKNDMQSARYALTFQRNLLLLSKYNNPSRWKGNSDIRIQWSRTGLWLNQLGRNNSTVTVEAPLGIILQGGMKGKQDGWQTHRIRKYKELSKETVDFKSVTFRGG